MYLRTNVPFQYTISGDREQVFLLYYKDFFEQICSDVQFISPPEEVGEFLLHLLKTPIYQKSHVNYSELLQLAKGWSNLVSNRIIIWRLQIRSIIFLLIVL